MNLEQEFTEQVVRDVEWVAKKCGMPRRSRFLQLVADHDQSAVQVWKHMPRAESSSGLRDLAESHLLFLSLEYKMLMHHYAALFDRSDRKEAFELLRDHKWRDDDLDLEIAKGDDFFLASTEYYAAKIAKLAKMKPARRPILGSKI
jgi:hypothetical protein